MNIPLKIENVTKFYGRSRGVQDVSFELVPGEVFGFLGPNGAGKTTTIRMMLDFIRPNSGDITIFGLGSTRDSTEIKKRIGYLAGDIALYGNLTGKQLLTYLAAANDEVDWSYVEELRTKLDADFKRPLKQLSKGNKQKIGLIQAFMHRPELVVLDEPTSGLDPLMQEVFYRLIADFKREGGTVFISSHNLSEVQKICDRAAFIREGKLIGIEQITHTQDFNVRRFTVWFRAKPKKSDFKAIKGITEVEITDKRATFTVTGSVDSFIKALARHEIESIDQQETTLEEVFMHYYAGESNV